ncbi:MAG: chloride channel protein [Lachnospiraceae bacterium]|nr:chloride channel protein [Lachnospiraceae bacterium]
MKQFFMWVFLGALVGVATGTIGTAFYYCLGFATMFRQEHPQLILGLPLGGLFIVWLYRVTGRENDKGTNMVISAVREENGISRKTAPLIFISTVITHLFGGSAGREGAALQMGGGIGSGIASLLRMDKRSVTTMIMCGMSGAFAALFGTPMAAAIFSLEVVSVGILYYAALVPTVIASLVASEIAQYWGVHAEHFTILELPEFTLTPALKIMLLSMLCAGVSKLFCLLLHGVGHFLREKLPNAYLRVVVGSVVVILLTVLVQSTDYMGAGVHVIEKAMNGEVRWEAFLLKMLFTAIVLSIGFKGGEIIPTLYIGATFGCLMGHILGISPSLCAAVGMAALFCGVTNSPVTSLLIALEMFGMDAFPYMMLGVAISYMLSGYDGLYESQKIVYSKFRKKYLGEQK